MPQSRYISIAMRISQTRQSAKRYFCLMSPRSAKRWGRRFVFAWLAMWLSTALLPCSEVLAAVASHERALRTECGHPAKQAPASGGSHKSGACLDVAGPAPVTPNTFVSGGNPTLFVSAVLAPSYVIPSLQGPSLPIAYRAAPPPVAVYLRSLRLLI